MRYLSASELFLDHCCSRYVLLQGTFSLIPYFQIIIMLPPISPSSHSFPRMHNCSTPNSKILDAITLSLLTCSNAPIALCFQHSTRSGSCLQVEARISRLVRLAAYLFQDYATLTSLVATRQSILLSVSKAALALQSRTAARTSGYAVGHKVSLSPSNHFLKAPNSFSDFSINRTNSACREDEGEGVEEGGTGDRVEILMNSWGNSASTLKRCLRRVRECGCTVW
jgi:hypothetical protein